MQRAQWRTDGVWLAVVAAFFIVGACGLPMSDNSALGTFSTAAGGKRGFYGVVERLNPPVVRTLHNFDDVDSRINTLCILGPARYPSTAEWQWLLQWVRSGKSLVFAARFGDPAVDLAGFGVRVVPEETMAEQSSRNSPDHGERDKQKDTGETAANPNDAASAQPAATEDKTDRPQDGKRRRRILEERQNIDTNLATGRFIWLARGQVVSGGEDWEVLATLDGRPQVVRKRVGSGTLIVCSSDYVFSNKSLVSFDNGVLAYRILEAAAPSGVAFDESLNGGGEPKVLGLLFESRVRPVTLQIMALLALFGWWGSRRFGPEQAASPVEHRSMSEHAIALGNLHRKSGTGGRAVSWYLQYLRDEMRLHYAGSSELAESSALARRSGADPQATATLLNQARLLIQQDRVHGGRAAHVIRELAKLKNKLDRGKGA